MENSQLADILRYFNKKEFREFGKFIHSPYHNNRAEVVRFYDAVKKYYPQFKSKLFTEKNIFSKVYPPKKYSDVMMRKLVSLMTGQAMDFMAIESFKESKLEYNVKLIDKLREKKLPALFEKKSKIIDEIFLKTRHTFGYYELKFKYTSIFNGYAIIKNEKSMVNKLQNELDDFTGYFLSVILLLYVRLSGWSREYNIKFDMKFYDEVLAFLSIHKFEDVPLVPLYYNMLMLLNSGEEKYFFDLRNARDKYEDKLSPIDDYNVAIVLMQYCYQRIQKGDADFRSHQFDITKLVLKNNLIPPGYIEPYFFTNIIRNAAHLNEFDWSEEFIKDFKDKLNPKFVKETVNYSLAMVEFGKSNYENALNLLSTINIERSNMKIDIKNMLIMIYYELNYTEELLSLIDTYRHFLSRDKDMTEDSKKKNSVFLKFASALVKVKLNEKNNSSLNLKKEIEISSYFNSKDWLLEKIEQQ